MRVAFFSAKGYERGVFSARCVAGGHELEYIEAALSVGTAPLARGRACVCAFVNDVLSEPVLELLAAGGTRLVALRCAGFNQVDVRAAERLGISVARVPAYSPHAVAEHAVALILALNRKTHRAYNRVREHNFSLDGLTGFDLLGKTVGVIGTGKIGQVFARIMQGFGCRVLAADPKPDPALAACGVVYGSVAEVVSRSDIVSLHCPLTPSTKHLIDSAALASAKPGFMLVNTSRGAVVDSRALIAGLKSGRVGAVGLDVYEEEADLFFRDLSEVVIQDDLFARLLTFPNVLVTAHQAFLTHEALANIADTTLGSIGTFERTGAVPAECAVTGKLLSP